ncbi:vacuolar protein sorting-associated protein 35, putative [Entamoeba histolytica HM-1:IMSS-B]|uniref:Vacuolar protein sorting-associated protein 35 n=5 Tax=Entamoeba histolytica TaxID=5759 RepID=C4M3E8_ENTH1|nr:hypothetical protein EHI_095930 [Entamoeba histolytica HM-1:IMSS]EMD47129.1 vacuolar protein sorting-associated protein, putative [Entamoeba histolytica KU27]EMH77667.1 vacuolar protein sorting-associated protein 35, putative [Entamoeba histolytica HM-1:IMSS-B]ENY63195.1 vacuolar protein sorting-associated protein 35 protein, putative [Entamoeba histolytica HM-1:IMSS-A]GAT95838.1 hypothetical protein CL6EHI_095930 [Entamoeba histolytica]EAL49498.1 hypothetical protein EHI_095930 [Entamoeba |eukprot:XP_654884.1 hypothetical protein EHI_095930 [Entamoeba histolytica HM-1:IMSS]
MPKTNKNNINSLPPMEVVLSNIRKSSKQLKELFEFDKIREIIDILTNILTPLSYNISSQCYYQIYLTCVHPLEEFQTYLQQTKMDLNLITSFILQIPDAVVRCYMLMNVAVASIHKGQHYANRSLNALLTVIRTVSLPTHRVFALNHLSTISIPVFSNNSTLAIQFLLSHIALSLRALSHVVESEYLVSDQAAPICTLALRSLRYLSSLELSAPLFRAILMNLQKTVIECSTTAQEFFYLILIETFPVPLQLVCMPEILAGLTSPMCKIDLKLCLAPFLDKLPNVSSEYHFDIIESIQAKVVQMVNSGLTSPNDGALLLVSILRIIFSWYNKGSYCQQLEHLFKSILSICSGQVPTGVQFHICMALELTLRTIPLLNAIKVDGFLTLLNLLLPSNERKIARLVVESLQRQNVILKSYSDASLILKIVRLLLQPEVNDIDAQNDLSMALSIFPRIKISNKSSCALTLSLVDQYINIALGEVPLKSIAEVELQLIIHSQSAMERDVLFERFLNRIKKLVTTNAPLAIGLALQAMLAGEKAQYIHSLYFFEFAVGETEIVEDDFIKAECLEKIIGAVQLLSHRQEYNDMVLLLTKHAKAIANRPKRCKEVLNTIHLWKSGNEEMIKSCIKIVLDAANDCEIECGERLRIEALNHLIWCVQKGTFSDFEFINEVLYLADINLNTIFPSQVSQSFKNTKMLLQQLKISKN